MGGRFGSAYAAGDGHVVVNAPRSCVARLAFLSIHRVFVVAQSLAAGAINQAELLREREDDMAGDVLTQQPENAQSVKEMAYGLFQTALLEGKLRSGQLVSQRDLVGLLHLSIGALRELLPRLEAEGLITVVPKRGIQITAIDLPMIRDAFQMRAALEREAVIAAVSNMPDETIAEQRALHVEVLEAAQKDASEENLERGQAVDYAFHNLLIHSTGNEILVQAYNINSIRIRLIKRERIALTERFLPQAYGDHIAIIDALAKRDVLAAIEAMDNHISNARQRAMEL